MRRILVLGASGYIGSHLVPLLLERGYAVTATARQIDLITTRFGSHEQLRCLHLDLENEAAVSEAMAEQDVVFFLVHGMAHGHDFIDYELNLAQNVTTALNRHPVKHLIYLSALQPANGRSEHLQARFLTGEILRQSAVPVTELRAGVIIGPGSAAYEIMRDFVYNLPILITPKWVDNYANPIALANLNHYLLMLAEHKASSHEILEAGGPDTLTYRAQFKELCAQTSRPFRLWATPLLTPMMAARWLGVITSVPAAIGKALLGGLGHHFVASSDAIRKRYPQALVSYRDAVREALELEGEFIRSNVWGFDETAIARWQPGFGYYPKQTGASYRTRASALALWQQVTQVGSHERGYFFATGLWRLREWLDVLFGGGKPIRRVPEHQPLQVGDHIDSWKVIRCEPKQFLSLLFGMKGPGLGRLEFQIRDFGEERELTISAWWHPKGLPGLLYWFAMFPAHLFIFKGMVKALCRSALLNHTQSNQQGGN
ncbi:SDR family oxidoreductase [Vibrio sp. SM6]|uniref:SDR family oxidoreductase n=1 Tax=Vibrio agarilyticus TaxID=2726741 RepID=A0A7X8TMC0_9VIBR|nr:DUF2867 domain-containing protein [Vibrio agarilyticus]NLS11390.1 SDR family oxidoreductase [Vibrio agarilyticus]